MATPATRLAVLSLYRRLLRSVRKWPGPDEEKKYILDETREKFRENRNIAYYEDIECKIFEGATRLEIGWHYLIPYPRPYNLPPGTVTGQKKNDGSQPFPTEKMGSLEDEEEEEIPVLRGRKKRPWQTR